MIYMINEEECKRNEVAVEELLLTLLVKTGTDIPKSLNSMIEEGKIVKDSIFNTLLVSKRWDDTICTVLLNSDTEKVSDERIDNLVTELMEVFPKEKKTGTCHYFRGNRKDNVLRLKKFFKLYGNKYTDDQIISAARKYVESFNGNYSYMRILKYFIWKDQKKVNEEGIGYIEETSDLASYIDNLDAGDNSNNEWTTTLC